LCFPNLPVPLFSQELKAKAYNIYILIYSVLFSAVPKKTKPQNPLKKKRGPKRKRAQKEKGAQKVPKKKEKKRKK
jgi:hypothetical protein